MVPPPDVHTLESVERSVTIEAAGVELEGDLAVPQGATGIVVFAHGSGSSRHSSRNRFVAEMLRRGNLGTLLLDLLTSAEEQVDLRTRELRFDIGLLAGRLIGAMDWLGEQNETRELPIGLFGASTGAGAALIAAARRPDRVGAVVSRGGRPDLAGSELRFVHAPTLLIVGSLDTMVIELNKRAMVMMDSAPVELAIIPGASHLFEEPGTLEQVAELARSWFVRFLSNTAG
jgi:pimeloyl-ACP methyl ester carboxylesterase